MSHDPTRSHRVRRIVRFRDGMISRDVRAFDAGARPLPGPRFDGKCEIALNVMLGRAQGVKFSRVFSSLTPGELDALVDRAKARHPEYEPPDLHSFFFADAPEDWDPAMHDTVFLDKAFGQLVASVGRARPGRAPEIHPNANGPWMIHAHFHETPMGTAAELGWNHVDGGGDGTGIRFADIESVRLVPHMGLPMERIREVGQEWQTIPGYHDHATAVLGIVLAQGDRVGVFGAAPNVDAAYVVSNYIDGAINTADAITVAASKLRAGDVLLIESQSSAQDVPPINDPKVSVPVECDSIVCEAIRLATRAGIVVVEPGGNGDEGNRGVPIDTLVRDDGTSLDPDAEDADTGESLYVDSGAILVSAARLQSINGQHKNVRLDWAPHGKRVDCYARGIDVTTCRIQPGSLAEVVSQTFKGTSAAAAIIAATAVQVQGIALSRNEAPLDPEDLRQRLSDARYGTAAEVDPQNPRLIGSMPDLALLLEDLPRGSANADQAGRP